MVPVPSDLRQLAQEVRDLLNRNGGASRLSGFPKLWSSNRGNLLDYREMGYYDLRDLLNQLDGIYVDGYGNSSFVRVMNKASENLRPSTVHYSEVPMAREQLLEESWAALCPACDLFFVHPVLLPTCGHVVCFACLSRISSAARVSDPLCPECEKPLGESGVDFVNVPSDLYKELNKLITDAQIRCMKADCPWKGAIREYRAHAIEECQYIEGPDMRVDISCGDPIFPNACRKLASSEALYHGLVRHIREVIEDNEKPEQILLPERDRFLESLRRSTSYEVIEAASRSRRERFFRRQRQQDDTASGLNSEGSAQASTVPAETTGLPRLDGAEDTSSEESRLDEEGDEWNPYNVATRPRARGRKIRRQSEDESDTGHRRRNKAGFPNLPAAFWSPECRRRDGCSRYKVSKTTQRLGSQSDDNSLQRSYSAVRKDRNKCRRRRQRSHSDHTSHSCSSVDDRPSLGRSSDSPHSQYWHSNAYHGDRERIDDTISGSLSEETATSEDSKSSSTRCFAGSAYDGDGKGRSAQARHNWNGRRSSATIRVKNESCGRSLKSPKGRMMESRGHKVRERKVATGRGFPKTRVPPPSCVKKDPPTVPEQRPGRDLDCDCLSRTSQRFYGDSLKIGTKRESSEESQSYVDQRPTRHTRIGHSKKIGRYGQKDHRDIGSDSFQSSDENHMARHEISLDGQRHQGTRREEKKDKRHKLKSVQKRESRKSVDLKWRHPTKQRSENN